MNVYDDFVATRHGQRIPNGLIVILILSLYPANGIM